MSDTFESLSFYDRSGLGSEWRDKANCKGLDPNLFFADRGDGHTFRQAVAVCAGCIVVEQCLHYAISNNIKVGIYGGLSERQRRRIRRERKDVI